MLNVKCEKYLVEIKQNHLYYYVNLMFIKEKVLINSNFTRDLSKKCFKWILIKHKSIFFFIIFKIHFLYWPLKCLQISFFVKFWIQDFVFETNIFLMINFNKTSKLFLVLHLLIWLRKVNIYFWLMRFNLLL